MQQAVLIRARLARNGLRGDHPHASPKATWGPQAAIRFVSVATFAQYALGHVSKLLGGSLVVEITPRVVKRYQADRLKEKAGPKTINAEVQLLLRLLCGEQGALIRATLRRDKALKLPLPPSPGRPYSTGPSFLYVAKVEKSGVAIQFRWVPEFVVSNLLKGNMLLPGADRKAGLSGGGGQRIIASISGAGRGHRSAALESGAWRRRRGRRWSGCIRWRPF